MAKATSGTVMLELTPREAKALHALTDGTCHKGVLADEVEAVFEALESCGVSSDDCATAWDKDNDSVYLKEA